MDSEGKFWLRLWCAFFALVATLILSVTYYQTTAGAAYYAARIAYYDQLRKDCIGKGYHYIDLGTNTLCLGPTVK